MWEHFCVWPLVIRCTTTDQIHESTVVFEGVLKISEHRSGTGVAFFPRFWGVTTWCVWRPNLHKSSYASVVTILFQSIRQCRGLEDDLGDSCGTLVDPHCCREYLLFVLVTWFGFSARSSPTHTHVGSILVRVSYSQTTSSTWIGICVTNVWRKYWWQVGRNWIQPIRMKDFELMTERRSQRVSRQVPPVITIGVILSIWFDHATYRV